MNAIDKSNMMMEAEMQVKALKRIHIWKMIAVAISTVGVAFTYAGMAGATRHMLLGILGIILTFVSVILALLFNLGLKNGRRNVEKILHAVDAVDSGNKSHFLK